MGYTQVYNKLFVTSLTPEFHENTCGYWFTVTNGSTAHTAFETRAGLDRWMSERGLTLENELPEAGTFGTSRIIGEYRTVMHGEHSPTDDEPYRMVEGDDWSGIKPVVITTAMSNAEYTLALITEDAGVRTVHTLNVNIKTRFVFDRRKTDALMR